MLRKLCFLTAFVLVFALSGLATATVEEGYIDDPHYNLSFEDDVNGNQIWCKIEHLPGKVLAWNDNGVDFANVEIACADACDVPECICKDDPCTDGIIKLTMGQNIAGPKVIVWQSLNPAYDANVIIRENYLYRVSYDAFEWNNKTLKAYLFYGNIPGPNTSQNPDVNVIVWNQPPCTYQYQTFSIEFAALPGQPYIGKPLGIRFFQTGAGWFWIDNIQIYFKMLTTAHFPNPADGATNVSKNAILKWAPGVLAQKKGAHDVYFGTSFTDVNSATTATATIFKGNQDPNNYDPPGAMTLGKTYFWRIDEVNGSTKWRGDVWTFDIEGYATNPYPADGAVDVPDDVILKWTRGTDAKYHNVYFGTSESAVEAATTATSGIYKTQLNKGTEQYDPVAAVGKQYFWRIDEVNTITVKGYVWDFRVANWILVDDFDSYISDTDLKTKWKPVNTTTVTFSLNKDANFANEDGNSMKFEYNNDATPYRSEVKRTYSPAQDWSSTGNSVTLMELSYYGDVHNFPDGNVYVELSDGTNTKKVYNPLLVGTTIDANVPWAEPWQHVWNIPLKNFTGVTMSKVSSILIGVGNGAGIGGKSEDGTFYFDDIILWPPRCFLEYKPTADLTDDCKVDVNDLAVVVEDWCKTGGWFLPGPPATRPVVEYLYEEGTGGAGTMLDNTGTYGSSHDLKYGYGVNASHVLTRDPNNNPVWMTDSDPCRHYNLWFDGNVGHLLTHETKAWPKAPGGDYLAMPGLNLNSNAVTLTTWVKPDPPQTTGWTGLIHTRSGASGSDGNSIAGLHYLGDGAAYNGILGYTWNDDDSATWGFVNGGTIPDDQWSMVAVVIEPEQATLYLVNTKGTPTDHNDDVLLKATNPVANEQEEWDGHFACIAADGGYVNGMGGWQTRALRGQLDGTRVYDYSLTTAEILGLGEMKTKIYLQLNSDADLCVGNKNPTYPAVDDQIDFCDYSKFADEWLVETLWPLP